MGYTLAIRCRSKAERTKMKDFLRINGRSWGVVSGSKAHEHTREVDDDLSYDWGKMALGFDYQSGLWGFEREHTYAVTRWMAIQIGQRKARFSKDVVHDYKVTEAVPFIVYDGYESWPVFVVETAKEAMKLPKDVRWCAFDNLGMRVGEERYNHEALHNAMYDNSAALREKLPKSEVLTKEIEALGVIPANISADESTREVWRERRRLIRKRHMKLVVDATWKVLRTEMRRLDKLWKALL